MSPFIWVPLLANHPSIPMNIVADLDANQRWFHDENTPPLTYALGRCRGSHQSWASSSHSTNRASEYNLCVNVPYWSSMVGLADIEGCFFRRCRTSFWIGNANPCHTLGNHSSGFNPRRSQGKNTSRRCMQYVLAAFDDVCNTFLWKRNKRNTRRCSSAWPWFCYAEGFSKYSTRRNWCYALSGNDDSHWGSYGAWCSCWR